MILSLDLVRALDSDGPYRYQCRATRHTLSPGPDHRTPGRGVFPCPVARVPLEVTVLRPTFDLERTALCLNGSAAGSQGGAAPPDVQGGDVSVADGLLPGCLGAGFAQGDWQFDKAAVGDHNLAFRTACSSSSAMRDWSASCANGMYSASVSSASCDHLS